MEVSIDPSVTFTLRDGAIKIRVNDVLDLEEFARDLWETKANESFLDYAIIESETREFLKRNGNEDADKLTKSELRGIFTHAPKVWAKKNESWREQDDASPTSQPATDLLQAD